MKTCFFALVLAGGVACAGELKIDDPWIRAVPPGSKATAAFMTFSNSGSEVVEVTGGATPVALEVKPMITTKSKVDGHDVMGMEFVDRFSVEPGKKRVLEPGGDHIMLMKLKSVPKAGEVVALTIHLESNGKTETRTLQVPVR